jgi:kynurenine 3-monooxygenase
MVDGKIRCAVVGAGPVGALAALYAARRGYDVDVYELRGGKSMSGSIAFETY